MNVNCCIFKVDAKVPEGEGQDDAYVLFYRRSGLPFTVNLPHQLAGSSVVSTASDGGGGGEKEPTKGDLE